MIWDSLRMFAIDDLVQLRAASAGKAVGLILRRISSVSHIVGVAGDGIGHSLVQICVGPHEAREFSKRKTEHVVKHEHLNVTMNAGANANRRNS